MTSLPARLLAASIFSIALTGTALAADPSSSTRNFIKNAAIGGTFEVEASKIALGKSQNDKVKQFAQQMIDDHSKGNNELKSTVTKANLDTGLIPATLDSEHQKMLDKLNSDSASRFDKDFIRDQQTAHKEAISLFKGYAKTGDNADLKQFAGALLPILKAHRDHLKQLKSAS